jgi:hypothetical protein
LNIRLKYFFKGVAVLGGVLLVLYLALYIYVFTHKKDIIKQVTDEAGKELNGNISIGDVDLSFFSTFPQISIFLGKVEITDSLFVQHHHAFFIADKVFAQLSILRLIEKKSAIDGFTVGNAAIYLYTDSSGYSNEYLIRPKENSTPGKTKSNESNILKSVILKNVQFTLDDKKKGKLYDIAVRDLKLKLNELDSVLLISARANLLIHSLTFNMNAGSFVQEKTFEGNFHFRIDHKIQRLQFDSIDIKIARHLFNLSGWFDLKGPNPQMQLKIHTRNIFYSFARTLLTPKIATALSIVDIDKKLDADAFISGPLKGNEPLITVNWKVKNSHLKNPFFDFDDATFIGSFTNEIVKGVPRFDKNSEITLSHFSAKWNGLPVTSDHIEISNLSQPLLSCDLKSSFPLIDLNELLGSRTIELRSGTGIINLAYKGPFEKNTTANSFITGIVAFSNGTVFYMPRGVEMKNVNGELVFKNSDIFVKNLQCFVLNNKIVMSGHATELITLMNTKPNQSNIKLNIYSPSLNLTPFSYLLKERKTISNHNTDKRKLNKIAQKIDAILDDGSINVILKADKLQYKKFEASNVVGNISLLQDRYLLNKVSMKEGNGSIDIHGSLVNRKTNFHEAIIDASIDNVDVNKMFTAFNNFGQKGIEAQNIKGKLSAKVNASLGLNDDGNAYPSSITSTVDFSLKKGALIHFEPIKKLQNFLFKNRDFDTIKFAELKDRLTISNQDIKINRMEIESNVFTIFVEGIYSLKGNTDISIQVPLSNLKKRDSDYKPQNTGTNKNPGISLFFRGRPGTDGSIQFKPDLFKKFGK